MTRIPTVAALYGRLWQPRGLRTSIVARIVRSAERQPALADRMVDNARRNQRLQQSRVSPVEPNRRDQKVDTRTHHTSPLPEQTAIARLETGPGRVASPTTDDASATDTRTSVTKSPARPAADASLPSGLLGAWTRATLSLTAAGSVLALGVRAVFERTMGAVPYAMPSTGVMLGAVILASALGAAFVAWSSETANESARTQPPGKLRPATIVSQVVVGLLLVYMLRGAYERAEDRDRKLAAAEAAREASDIARRAELPAFAFPSKDMIEGLEEAARRNPKDGWVEAKLTDAYLMAALGTHATQTPANFDVAAAHARRAATLEPRSAYYRAQLGLALTLAEHFQAADSAFAAALALDPSFLEIQPAFQGARDRAHARATGRTPSQGFMFQIRPAPPP